MSANIAVVQTTIIEDKLLLRPNKKFDKILANSTTVLANTPQSVTYTPATATANGNTNLSFDFAVGSKLFLDRGVHVEMRIPINLTRKAITTPATTVLEWANNFDNICWRQYGLIQGVQSIDLKFDSSSISTITDVSQNFEAISEYHLDDLQ
jgi:hypothetical protein